ncbi:MAG TPA: DUF429 domain-containing protein [Opitutales bacterium]|nr:DUF429 domain-containing protein [Opitutales bacterium]
MSMSLIVAGVDVGGSKKGFHAVVLQDGAYLDHFKSREAGAIADRCRRIGVSIIGVDSPCRWNNTDGARLAERELMKEKIWCFSTPTREIAEIHPKDHFRWMLKGADLFECLESSHALFTGDSKQLTRPLCFETFPQAVACVLAGKIVSAKKKSSIRRDLLIKSGLDTSRLTNIDQLDAALCAITAQYFAHNNFKTYGEALTGLIVVPRRTITSPTPRENLGWRG